MSFLSENHLNKYQFYFAVHDLQCSKISVWCSNTCFPAFGIFGIVENFCCHNWPFRVLEAAICRCRVLTCVPLKLHAMHTRQPDIALAANELSTSCLLHCEGALVTGAMYTSPVWQTLASQSNKAAMHIHTLTRNDRQANGTFPEMPTRT